LASALAGSAALATVDGVATKANPAKISAVTIDFMVIAPSLGGRSW
jgi:hypothetical protein